MNIILSDFEKHITILYYSDGYTCQDIADLYGCSKMWISTSLKRLRKLYKEVLGVDLVKKHNKKGNSRVITGKDIPFLSDVCSKKYYEKQDIEPDECD